MIYYSGDYQGLNPLRQKINYNALAADPEVSEGDTVVEPVDLDTVKDHLQITYNDADVYLTRIITACRKAVERFTGLSLVQKTITAALINGCGNVELPYGPVSNVTSIADADNNTLATDAYELTGTSFPLIKRPIANYLKVVYTVGYAAGKVPEDLQLAILNEAAYRWAHRGDTNPLEGLRGVTAVRTIGLSETTKDLCFSYKRTTWL